MKHTTFNTLILAASTTLLFAACTDHMNEDRGETPHEETLSVNTDRMYETDLEVPPVKSEGSDIVEPEEVIEIIPVDNPVLPENLPVYRDLKSPSPKESCAFDQDENAQTFQNANHDQACLEEVFAGSGCLSGRVWYEYDAQGKITRETSQVYEFDLLLQACGPYGDFPKSYEKTWDYASNANTPTTISEAPNAGEQPVRRDRYEYNDQGRQTAHAEEWRDGETGQWRSSRTMRTTYDVQGRITSKYNQNADSKKYGTRYAHDEEGRVIAEYRISPQGEYKSVSREFDRNGLLVREAYLTPEGAVQRESTWQRGADKTVYENKTYQILRSAPTESGKVRMHTRTTTTSERELTEVCHGDACTWRRYESRTFDRGGRLLIHERYDNKDDSKILYQHIHEYDVQGNLVRAKYDYEANGSIDSVREFVYQNGQLTQELEDNDADGTPERVTTHKFDAQYRPIYMAQDLNGDGVIDQSATTRYGCAPKK